MLERSMTGISSTTSMGFSFGLCSTAWMNAGSTSPMSAIQRQKKVRNERWLMLNISRKQSIAECEMKEMRNRENGRKSSVY